MVKHEFEYDSDIHTIAERLCSIATARGRNLDVADTAHLLMDMTAPRVRVVDIQRFVCDHYKIDHHEMMSLNMNRKVSSSRQIAYYICWQLTMHSHGGLARFFCRDRGTVIHGIASIKRRLIFDEQLSNDIACLMNKITDEYESNLAQER